MSAVSTCWSSTSESGSPSTVPPAPGRNLAPTVTMPPGAELGTGPVSGPARKLRAPCCQTRSTAPSGSTRVVWAGPGGVMPTHRQDRVSRSPAGGANSR